MTTSRRPRVACQNCARSGVLPDSLLTFRGGVYCTDECRWAYALTPGGGVPATTRLPPPQRLSYEAELKLLRQQLANAERVHVKLARRAHPHAQRAPPAPPPNQCAPAQAPAPAPVDHVPEAHALFAFSALLGHD